MGGEYMCISMVFPCGPITSFNQQFNTTCVLSRITNMMY